MTNCFWSRSATAVPVGFYESKNFKFSGVARSGFSEKLLSTLYSELNKIRVDKCPFFNLPATGRNRWDQGLSAAKMRRCHWVRWVMVCQIKFTEWMRDDQLRLSRDKGRQECEGSGAGEGDLKIGARGALDNVTGLKSTSLSRLPSRHSQ
jgi:ATP-dependent DNA ligase